MHTCCSSGSSCKAASCGMHPTRTPPCCTCCYCSLYRIPAALPGREGVEKEIFGMAGVPPGAKPGLPWGDGALICLTHPIQHRNWKQQLSTVTTQLLASRSTARRATTSTADGSQHSSILAGHVTVTLTTPHQQSLHDGSWLVLLQII